MAPDALIQELMAQVRSSLFRTCPEKWFTQQEMVKKALTYPAAWLGKRQVEIPAARYRTILEGILTLVLSHGDLAKVTYLSRYFYTAVQKHMDHHGDEYYREGISIRNRIKLSLSAVERARLGADSTVPMLSQVHAALAAGRRQPARKLVAPSLQRRLL